MANRMVKINGVKRVLPKGVSVRNDGRFMYRYNVNGKQCAIYARTLEEMKEKIEDLQFNLYIGKDMKFDKMSLNDWWDTYLDVFKKGNCKIASFNNKVNYYDWYVRPYPIGGMKLGDITTLHVTAHFKMLAEKGCKQNGKKEKGLGKGTLNTIANMLKLAMDAAITEKVVFSNPFQSALLNVNAREQKKVDAISKEEQDALVEYLKKPGFQNRWLPYFGVLLTTGLREGEALALTWDDIDFEKNTIRVSKTMQYRNIDGHRTFFINTPKTVNGFRELPMSEQTRKLFMIQKEYQKEKKIRQDISISEINNNGDVLKSYKGFVFTTGLGMPFTNDAVLQSLRRVVNNYNKEETALAHEENREPIMINEDITVHMLRHTYTTRVVEAFYESGNPDFNLLRVLLGHSNIQTTIDVYTSITKSMQKQAVKSIEGLIAI